MEGHEQIEETEETAPDQAAQGTDEAPAGDGEAQAETGGEESGPLAGTSSELEPGVGGTGDHPAPAAMRDESGDLHVAGEAPAGTAESNESPAGDSTDLQSGDVVDPEAREKLNAETEPEQVETDRPDIGTE